MSYEAVVIGVSAGGLHALREIFINLDQDFMIPILIVQHLHAHSDGFLAHYLNKLTHLNVKEADEKELIQHGHAYIAPANYHLIIDDDRTIALTTESQVNYSRPSIDVMFESAAEVYSHKLIGIILTGANNDGTNGMLRIKEKGGLLIVQDPLTAEASSMPLSVINQMKVNQTLSLKGIAQFLNKIVNPNSLYIREDLNRNV